MTYIDKKCVFWGQMKGAFHTNFWLYLGHQNPYESFNNISQNLNDAKQTNLFGFFIFM